MSEASEAFIFFLALIGARTISGKTPADVDALVAEYFQDEDPEFVRQIQAKVRNATQRIPEVERKFLNGGISAFAKQG